MEYESNIKLWVTQLVPKLKNASINSAMLRTIATDLRASNLRRIHNEGLAVDETSIGSYSTKPILAGSKSFRTKTGSNRAFSKEIMANSEWKTIKRGNKNYRLMVIQGGYKDIRALDGDETNYVNLQRTRRLFKSLKMVQEGVDWLIGFADDYGRSVSEGQEKKWGKKIWGVTKSDERQIEITVNEFLKKDLNAST